MILIWAVIGRHMTPTPCRWNPDVECLFCPGGLCHCNCGQLAPIAKRNSIRDQLTKGMPYRYVFGHSLRRADNLKKGRKGEANGSHKLRDEDIPLIRLEHSQGMPTAALAAQFGVSSTAIKF